MPHEALVLELDKRESSLSARCQKLIRSLTGAPAQFPLGELELRAHVAVAASAELEGFVRGSIRLAHEELNRSHVRLCDLEPCVRQLAAHSNFQGLLTGQSEDKLWSHRAAVTQLERNVALAKFPLPTKGPTPPLDGRTLVPDHFNRLWTVYGFHGDPLPDGRSDGHLRKLALLRNDLAHGNFALKEIFAEPSRESRHLVDYVESMRRIAAHMLEAWRLYLGGLGYSQIVGSSLIG